MYSQTCDICGRPAHQQLLLISGEPMSICDAGDCHDRFDVLVESEETEMRDIGLLPPLDRDA